MTRNNISIGYSEAGLYIVIATRAPYINRHSRQREQHVHYNKAFYKFNAKYVRTLMQLENCVHECAAPAFRALAWKVVSSKGVFILAIEKSCLQPLITCEPLLRSVKPKFLDLFWVSIFRTKDNADVCLAAACCVGKIFLPLIPSTYAQVCVCYCAHACLILLLIS